MWRLWAKLFGWKYVLFTYGFSHVIRKIQKDKYGNEYVLYCGAVIRPNNSDYRGWIELN
jgi:hypothetical protein